MSKFLPGQEPEKPTAIRREFWTATATWRRYDGTEKVWRVEAETITALSVDELRTVARHIRDIRGGLEDFELMVQHHPIDRPAYRITNAIPTNPDDVPNLLAAARAAMKRSAS